MKSRGWLRGFALVCGTSLLAGRLLALQPAVALLDETDAMQWKAWTAPLGWSVVAPAPGAAGANIETRVQALAAAVQEAVQNGGVDPARVYVAGRGDAAAAVFYAVSRIPDRWAAGVALGGSPKRALDSNRIFAANFTNTPVLWIGSSAEDLALANKLKAAGLNLEWRSAEAVNMAAMFEWLAAHTREETPASIDCETNSPTYARCYWIQMTKFDVSERNDVLRSTLVPGGSGATLDLGGFGYQMDDPGPGILVSYLPAKYSGPLKMGDRIVALDGKPVVNARQFAETMDKATSEKTVVVLTERGKDRIRMETRLVLPRRDLIFTARVQAKFTPEDRQIQIISRTTTEMRVTVPPAWVPGDLYWNGLALQGLKTPGCYLLSVQQELLHSSPCEK